LQNSTATVGRIEVEAAFTGLGFVGNIDPVTNLPVGLLGK
jgi:hypothetical protein